MANQNYKSHVRKGYALACTNCGMLPIFIEKIPDGYAGRPIPNGKFGHDRDCKGTATWVPAQKTIEQI